MEKYGRGSTGPTVELGRGEDKHSYPGPQEKEEDDPDH
jgi:hypothetical protein